MRDIKKYHEAVKSVEINDCIIVIIDFVQHAGYIADKDRSHEQQAFAFRRLGPKRLVDSHGPRYAEADQHSDLE